MQQQAHGDIQSLLIHRNKVTLQHSEDFIDPDKKENWHISLNLNISTLTTTPEWVLG